MKVVFVTIVLDGMPFITHHYWQWQWLSVPWEWKIAEGVAAPERDTFWVRPMPPRLSNDGTTQFLDSIAAFDSRVQLFRKALWPGKAAMLNKLLETIYEPVLLVEVDHDETWSAEQIEKMVALFERHPKKNAGLFRCKYHVGPNLVTSPYGSFGNHTEYEWLRAWRYECGMRFSKHEPPVMDGLTLNAFTHEETEKAGLVFRHYAYATEAQVKWKQEYYGSSSNPKGHLYAGIIEKWRTLQNVTQFPVRLQDYFPFVDDKAMVDRV